MSNIKTAFCVRAKHRIKTNNNTKKYYNQVFFITNLIKIAKFQQKIWWYVLFFIGKTILEVEL